MSNISALCNEKLCLYLFVHHTLCTIHFCTITLCTMPNACSIVCTYTRESVPYRECTHLNSPRCITGRDVGTVYRRLTSLLSSKCFCLNCKLSFCNCKIYLMQLQKVILTLHYKAGQYRRPHYLWLLWSGLRGVRQGLSVARIYRLKCDAFKS